MKKNMSILAARASRLLLCASALLMFCGGTAVAGEPGARKKSAALTPLRPGGSERTLFRSFKGQHYRIPAIACTRSGDLIAISDDRHDTGYDVGQGGVLDVLMRRSTDGGFTWTDAVKVADSQAYPNVKGFGDASIVSDRESDRVMMLCASDSLGIIWPRNGKEGVYRYYSDDGGRTWDKGTCITDMIYGQNKTWTALFIASGRIMQSRVVKVGKYYRIYCVTLVIATPDRKPVLYGNGVIYSDDFGATWQTLGNAEVSPCPRGDEAKVEELSDGTVILSSRTLGRYFNVFRYADKNFTTGEWTGCEKGASFNNIRNVCNGEIMRVPVTCVATGKTVDLMLQSVPAGPGRRNVSIYYKELESGRQYTAAEFGDGWTQYRVCTVGSAYSTMCMLPDGRVAFLYERDPLDNDNAYDTVFLPLSIRQITGGKYEGIPDNPRAAKRLLRQTKR